MVRKKIRRVIGEKLNWLAQCTALVAAVALPQRAHATALQPNPNLEIEGLGVNFSIDGVGLRGTQFTLTGDGGLLPYPPAAKPAGSTDTGSRPGVPPHSAPPPSENVGGNAGFVSLPIGGPILKAYLYWGGRGQLPGDSTIKLNDEIVDGTLIGTEATAIDIAYAYRADVTVQLQALFIPPGTLQVEIQDATPAVNILDGASLLVVWRDLSDPFGYTVQVFEGCDYAYAPRPGEMGVTTPVNFTYDPDDQQRAGQIALVFGDAISSRPDRITVSDNPTLVNTINASDGAEWDTDVYVINIPANEDTTTVHPISPPEFGFDSDSLTWTVGLLRAPCTALIGNFVWEDTDGDGIQDAGEPGIPDIRLQLYVVLPGNIKQFLRETTTDANGGYLFEGLCSGDYEVRVVPSDVPAGYVETIPFAGGNTALDSNCVGGVMTVTLPEDTSEDLTIDCGLFPGNVTGGCCVQGDCFDDLTKVECENFGGQFQGAGSSCEEINCPGVPGACCLLNGDCIEGVDDTACAAQGGAFQGEGSDCDEANCPQPTGACCLPTGVCQMRLEAACIAAGGAYQGDFSDCSEVDCPQPGACCLPNGTCRQEVVIGGATCVADGGTYQGNGTTCATVNCPGGACCLNDGSCVENTSLPACTAQGGAWAGLNITCTAANCPQPGACCLPDGSCRQETEIGNAACLASGGTYQGDGTECDRVECPGGACCLNDGSCLPNLSLAECTAQGGNWMGLNVSCAAANCPQPGACCLSNGTCQQMTVIGSAACTALGGTYQGNNTSCANVNCPDGACCLPDGSCLDGVDQPTCAAQSGVWQGIGSQCATANCPGGACCLTTGLCVENISLAACNAQGGTWAGLSVTCSAANCPGGSCCFNYGGCLENVTQPACETAGGQWQGIGVTCAAADCPQPGACCLPNGVCRIDSVIGGIECEADGGSYQGDNSTCATVDCPAGACCLVDGSCIEDIDAVACSAQGGSWTAIGVVCANANCPQPGACCLPDGTCRVESVLGGAQCEADGGTYAGDDVSCDLAGCPTGVCCLPDGTCAANTNQSQCDALGGTWGGVNSQCSGFNCAQPGACCLPDGTCRQEEVIGGAQCELDGGSYQGNGTTCGMVECPGGACCLDDGSCLEDVSLPECNAQGGAWAGLGVPCRSANCPQPGACCLGNGTCQQMTVIGSADCTAMGGTYQGDNSTCDTVTCPGGACCFSDGSCTEDISQTTCAGLKGVWQGLGVSCAQAACPQPGACCMPDGTCEMDTEIGGEKCTRQDGVYQGDDTTCATTDCPAGACCFSNGSCIDDLPQGDCIAMSGAWQGLNSTCATANCPQPGACCLPDGTCQQMTLIGSAQCTALGGTYQGDNSTCGTVSCPGGACCLNDGSCLPNISQPACTAQGGTWMGLNISCAAANCPQPGACCLPDGSCQQMTQLGSAQCTALGGTYQGDNSTCATVTCPQPGACCLPDGSCQLASALGGASCTAMGGTYQGDNSTCASVTCPQPGACCLPDGTCQQMTLIGPAQCTALGGTYQGDNSTCGTVSCPGGACCLDDGSCLPNISQPVCASLGGTWMGLNISCAAANCPQPGACCLADGSCQLALQLGGADCTAMGGAYQGDNSTCAGVTCPQPGACCLADGSCQLALQLGGADCTAMGGAYQGDNSTCAGVTCPQPGACCLPGGTCRPELLLGGAQCLADGGTYQGDGSTCATANCPQPPSACCLVDGSCVNVGAQQCADMNGYFYGAGILCGDPAENCPTPAPPDTGECSQKGSLLIWSDVEVRYDANDQLVQDTFITISNDYPDRTRVQFYFVNGDTWAWLDVMIVLTKDEPTYWRASDGMPKGVPPFTALEGILDPEGSGETVYRGFIVGWAVDAQGQEIKFNHLSGGAIIVNYPDSFAWEYTACAYGATPDGPTGSLLGTPGQLVMDGTEYEAPADILLLDFFAVNAPQWATMGITSSDMDLTLHPVAADLRQDSTGPVTTKAHFAIWNQNEYKLSGTEMCISCWSQVLASDYPAPNHFLLMNLQTDRGRARIDGEQTPVCDFDFDVFDGPLGSHPFDIVSQEAALLGVSSKLLYFGDDPAATGTNLVTRGKQSAIIHYDVLGGSSPERESGAEEVSEYDQAFDDLVRQWMARPR